MSVEQHDATSEIAMEFLQAENDPESARHFSEAYSDPNNTAFMHANPALVDEQSICEDIDFDHVSQVQAEQFDQSELGYSEIAESDFC
jgi:hypothetical protein